MLEFSQSWKSWNTCILLVYLCILEYLELGQFRNFCDVFHPEKAKKTTTKIKMTFHNSAHCEKSWAQLSFSPLARALRNVEKEGLESPSCMNASIWKEWKCIKCKFLCGIESRLPGCAESIFFPGARWHLSGCLGKHCWRLLPNTKDLMKNPQLHNFHNHHCHFGRDGGQDKMSIDLLRWRQAQIFQPGEM